MENYCNLNFEINEYQSYQKQSHHTVRIFNIKRSKQFIITIKDYQDHIIYLLIK